MTYKNNNNHAIRLTGSMIYNLPAGGTVTTQEVIPVLPPGVEEVVEKVAAEVIEEVVEEVVEEVPTQPKNKKRGRPKKDLSVETTDS